MGEGAKDNTIYRKEEISLYAPSPIYVRMLFSTPQSSDVTAVILHEIWTCITEQ